MLNFNLYANYVVKMSGNGKSQYALYPCVSRDEVKTVVDKLVSLALKDVFITEDQITYYKGGAVDYAKKKAVLDSISDDWVCKHESLQKGTIPEDSELPYFGIYIGCNSSTGGGRFTAYHINVLPTGDHLRNSNYKGFAYDY